MPLAIELAAGRLSTFSLADLHRRLDRALDLLGGRPSGEARHRTLRATVEWSYQLLGDDERRLFRYLSVFVDGIALDAAEQLATELDLAGDPGTVLSRLVDASMLEAEFAESTEFRGPAPATGCWRRCGRSGSTGSPPRARTATPATACWRWAVELTAWIGATLLTEHEPEADAVLRRELANLRAAWRSARRGADRRRRRRDRHRPLRRDHLPRSRGDPRLGRGAGRATRRSSGIPARPPCWAPPARRPTTAATTRPPSGSAGRGWSASPTTRPGGSAWCRWWWSRWPAGQYAEVVERCLAVGERGIRVGETLGIAALACAYSGNPDRARELQARGSADTVSPTMRAWSDYVAGEIENLAGRPEEAQRRYRRAIDLARGSGATFVVGVASVGLLTVLADAGRVTDALRGYRDVVDYFARTGNWTHLWPTLRNLADLLRRIGDPDPAAVLDAAADQAPDAPAHNGARPPVSSTTAPSRTDVLTVARNAIERNVRRVESRPASRSR